MLIGANKITPLLLLGGLLAVASASGQDSEAGEGAEDTEYRRLHYIDVPVPLGEGQDPSMPAPPMPLDPEMDPEFAQRIESIRQYQQAITQVEFDAGVWASPLIEQLNQLGSLQQQQGNHPEAIATFDRAIHINRINDGLNTLDQIPIVERMIDSYIALDNWAQADLYNNYLYYVQQRAYGASDPRIIPVLDRLANWHIQAFNVGYGDPLGLRLSSAQILFNAAARMVSIHFGRDDERFVELLRNLASTAYLASRYPEYLNELNRPENRLTQDTLRQQLNDGGGDANRRYAAGFDALSEIVEYYRQEPDRADDLAEALVHLADWQLIFERRRDAEELYVEVWQLLEQNDADEELKQRLFGQVVPLPAFMDEPVNLDPSSSESRESGNLQHAYVDVALDVTALGRVRNVRILGEEVGQRSSQLDSLQREIRNAYFRPLLSEGELVRSNDNTFRYRYWY